MFDLSRSKARHCSSYLLIAIAALAGSAPASATTTPQEEYGINQTCAALLTTGVPIPEGTPDKLVSLAKLYAERVQTSGKAIGKTPQQISQELAGARSDAMTRISVHDTKRASAERADIAKIEEHCAALPFFEAFGRHANAAAR